MKMTLFFKRGVAVLIDAIILGVLYKTIGNVGGLAWIIYEVCLLALWNGQTIGKKAMGLKVVPQPKWGTALVRTLMKIVSGIPLGLGFFWMLWDAKGQTWHDKVADTSVQ